VVARRSSCWRFECDRSVPRWRSGSSPSGLENSSCGYRAPGYLMSKPARGCVHGLMLPRFAALWLLVQGRSRPPWRAHVQSFRAVGLGAAARLPALLTPERLRRAAARPQQKFVRVWGAGDVALIGAAVLLWSAFWHRPRSGRRVGVAAGSDAACRWRERKFGGRLWWLWRPGLKAQILPSRTAATPEVMEAPTWPVSPCARWHHHGAGGLLDDPRGRFWSRPAPGRRMWRPL